MATKSRLFNTNDFEQLRRLTREGRSIRYAAEVIGCSPGTIHRNLAEDDDWRELIHADRLFAKEMAALDSEATMQHRAFDPGVFKKHPAISQRALEKLWDRDNGGPQRLEVSPPLNELLEGGPRPVSIADVVQLARELGIRLAIGVGGGDDRAALPAASDVLPDSAVA